MTLDQFFESIPEPLFELFASLNYPWEALDALPEFLASLQLGKIDCDVPPGVFLQSPETITIQEGTILEPGAYIAGPCFIGKNCQIRHSAYVRGGVYASDRCVIGHASEVKGSIFFPGAAAAHFNYVGDSILGHEVNLGAGVKIANLRLDREEVEVLYEGKVLSTGRRKFGAILGDRSQIGCNVALSPGTLLKLGAICAPPRFRTTEQNFVVSQ